MATKRSAVKKSATALAVTAAEKLDAWANAWSGWGDTSRDPMTGTKPTTVAPFTDAELDALFDDDHIAHKICVSLPNDATRKGATLKIDDDQEGKGDKILEFLADIGAHEALYEGLVWARQAGGCLLVLGVDDGQAPDMPLNEDRIRSFNFVNVVRHDRATIHSAYDDVTQRKYGDPEVWCIRSDGGAYQFVHESRVIHLRGELTTPQRRKERGGWDMSALQRAKEALQRNATAWHSLAALLNKSNMMVFGVNGFTNMVRSLKEALTNFQNRVAVSKMTQSVNSWLVHDSQGESVQNVSVNFGGIPEAMDRIMMETASAADMPVTKLWGRSPAGLNATGDSDLQLWDQQVESYQTRYVKPPLERLVHLAMMTHGSATGGKDPESWILTFPPLRVMTDSERAAVQLQLAQAMSILVNAQVFTGEEAALGAQFGDGGLLAGLAAVDQEARRVMLDAELKRMQEDAKNPPPPPPQFGAIPAPQGEGDEGEGGDPEDDDDEADA